MAGAQQGETTLRVGAIVDDVTGWTRCELSVSAGGVGVQLGRPGWVLPSRLCGTTIVHAGGQVPLVWSRWQGPWRRAGLVVFDDAHRVVVPLTRRRAELVRAVLEQHGQHVREIQAGPWDGAGPLAAQLQYRYLLDRRRPRGALPRDGRRPGVGEPDEVGR